MSTLLLNPETVARMLDVTPATVTRLAKRGQLRGRKVSGHWRFRPEWVDEYVDRQQPTPKQRPETRERYQFELTPRSAAYHAKHYK